MSHLLKKMESNAKKIEKLSDEQGKLAKKVVREAKVEINEEKHKQK